MSDTNNSFVGLGAGLDDFAGLMNGAGGAGYQLVSIDDIHVRPQVRTIFETDEQSLADLAEDIKAQGIMQPLLVRPIENGFELVAGERRYRAAKLAGLVEVPVIVKELSDEEAAQAQYSENTQRLDLTLQEEAAQLKKWLTELNGDRALLLSKVKKSEAWLSKRLVLLDMDAATQRLVDSGATADIAVVNNVRQVAKVDPQKATELVQTLVTNQQLGKGGGEARKITEEAKKSAKAVTAKPKKLSVAAPKTGVPKQPKMTEEDKLKTSLLALDALVMKGVSDLPKDLEAWERVYLALAVNKPELLAPMRVLQALKKLPPYQGAHLLEKWGQ